MRHDTNMAILALVGLVVLILIWVLSKWARKARGGPPRDLIGPRDQAVVGEIAPFREPIVTEDHALAVMIGLETHQSPLEIPDTGPVSLGKDGWWVLNPRSSFPLNVRGIDNSTGTEVKSILDGGYADSYQRTAHRVAGVISKSNLRCREIDTYVEEFKPRYLGLLEDMKKSSAEWSTASEPDREDLLAEFREDAIDSLDVRPACDLIILFEGEPSDLTVDDELIARYGWDTIRFYLRHAGDLGKVWFIPAGHAEREAFESLSSTGLALRGADIQLPAILASLRMKDMTNLVIDLGPPKFTRKSEAIAYLIQLPDIRERLGRSIAFRELFQLQPLAARFGAVDLKELSLAWKYVHEVASVITSTYISGGNHLRDTDSDARDVIRGWEILTSGEDTCPHCARAAAKSYTRRNPPKVPQHLACRCTLVPKV